MAFWSWRVPNSDSVQARAFGDHWLALDLPRHLVHLPARTLLRRLEDLRLRVTRTSYLPGGQGAFGWLHGFVGWLPGAPDLYDAIRRPEARREPLSRGRRAYALGAAAALTPHGGRNGDRLTSGREPLFDSEMLFQAVHFGFLVAEVSAPTRYFDDASSIRPRAATVYALKTLWTAFRLVLHRRGVPRSSRFQP